MVLRFAPDYKKCLQNVLSSSFEPYYNQYNSLMVISHLKLNFESYG